MAQIKKQSQSSSPHCPPPTPTSNPSGLFPQPGWRARWREGADSSSSEAGCRTSLGTPSCKRGQGPKRPQSQGKLLSVGCKPTNQFCSKRRNVSSGEGRCVCMVGAGQGGQGSWPYHCPKPQNEISLRTRDWWKTSEFNSKHLEKERKEKEMLLSASGTDLSLTPALLSPTQGELHSPRTARQRQYPGGGMLLKSP